MFIAVHTGCGYHSATMRPGLEKIAKKACIVGMDILKNKKKTAVDAIEAAIGCLEDSPLTNCGFGSNLTRTGQAECDASLMVFDPSGPVDKQQPVASTSFGAVGCIQGVKNPIALASSMARQNAAEESDDGLVYPCLLVGAGAHKFAEATGIETVAADGLITEQSRKRLKTHLGAAAKEVQTQNRSPLQSESRLDTVGAVCVDSEGRIAAGCSSGGLLLKHDGRVGQAATFGCGVFATGNEQFSVATTTTGVGEEIIKTQLASASAKQLLLDENAVDAMQAAAAEFLNSVMLGPKARREAGILALRVHRPQASEEENKMELVIAHSTHSLGVATLSDTDKSPTMTFADNDHSGLQKHMRIETTFKKTKKR